MTDSERLRIVVLTSRRAPGLGELLEGSGGEDAPYRIVGLLASEPEASALELARERGLPAVVHDVDAFTEERGGSRSDLAFRPEYDRATVRLLGEFRPDALLFCGYLLIATEPLLAAYRGRILNVHDADLRLRDDSGGPRYPGLRSTLDALASGEPETRSTIHLVTEMVDGGLPLAVSRAYPASAMVAHARRRDDHRMLRACAFAQREWMMGDCWGELMDRGLRLLAAGIGRGRWSPARGTVVDLAKGRVAGAGGRP